MDYENKFNDFVRKHITEEGIVDYLIQGGLLSNLRSCDVCHAAMALRTKSICVDKKVFFCNNCKKRVSFRKWTFFEKSQLSYIQVNLLISSFYHHLILLFLDSWLNNCIRTQRSSRCSWMPYRCHPRNCHRLVQFLPGHMSI